VWGGLLFLQKRQKDKKTKRRPHHKRQMLTSPTTDTCITNEATTGLIGLNSQFISF
jgi:hypothetical protein